MDSVAIDAYAGEQGSDIFEMYIFCCMYRVDSMRKLLESVDETETSSDVRCHDLRMTEKKRRGQPTRAHI